MKMEPTVFQTFSDTSTLRTLEHMSSVGSDSRHQAGYAIGLIKKAGAPKCNPNTQANLCNNNLRYINSLRCSKICLRGLLGSACATSAFEQEPWTLGVLMGAVEKL